MKNVVGKNILADLLAKTAQEEVKQLAPEAGSANTTQSDTVKSEQEGVSTESVATQETKTTPEQEVSTTQTTEATEVKPTEATTEPKKLAEPVKEDISEDAVRAFLKEKYGKDVEDVSTLFKESEAVVDPFEGLSDEAKQFLQYNKETGRSYNEYQSLNRDVEALTPLDIAREKAIKQSGGQLTSADVDAYLEKKLNIDLSNPKELEKFDLIELNTFGGDYKNQLLEDKKKYSSPIKKQAVDTDMVQLENGQAMTKAAYDAAVLQRNQYLEDIQKASDKITASSYDVKIDDNGVEKVIPLSYEYSKQDVLDMASTASDIDTAFAKLFSNEQGGIDHAKLQEGLWRADPNNFGKIVNAFVHKALAKQAEEFMAQEHNVKVETKTMPGTKSTEKRVPLPGQKVAGTGGYLQFLQK